MTGKLIRHFSEHQNLRTDEVEGEFSALPVVGERFLLTGAPLTLGADVRVVLTSVVAEVKECEDNVYEFKTQFSLYRLEVYL